MRMHHTFCLFQGMDKGKVCEKEKLNVLWFLSCMKRKCNEKRENHIDF